MTVTRKIVAALLAGVMVLVVGILAFVTVRQFVRATRGVDRTVEVILRVESVIAMLRDAESAQRGYLITNDSAYLRQRVGRDSIARQLAVLRELNADNPLRLARVDSLSVVVADKLRELDDVISVRDRVGVAAAIALVRTDRGMRLMTEARRLAAAIEDQERAILRDQELQRRRAGALALWIIALGTLSAVVLIIVINRSIQEDVEAAERSRRRLEYNARVSETLAASLDYEHTLAQLARLLVPDLADWCAISVSEGDGVPKQLAVAHVDPSKVKWAAEINERYPPDPHASTGVPQVLRTGRSEFYPAIPREMLAAAAVDAEHLRLLDAIGFTSAMVVPINARGRTLGAMTLVTAESGRRYTAEDLSLAEELGARAGVAVDNARLVRDANEARLDAERSQAAAVAASQAKSDFLATMSHEIRTPINAILGYSELLGLGLAGPLTEEQRRQLDRITSSTRHLLGLVNEVLDLAKVESGTMRVELAPAFAGDAVEAALALVRPQAVARGISVSDRCSGDRAARYLGDEPRVRQVLTNLLANAVKFTDAGGRVSIDCATGAVPGMESMLDRQRSYVAIRVHDTGIGIPEDQRQRIFQPFVQASAGNGSAYTRQRAGAGLGLAISRQLAHLMGGDITVQSEVGAGSTFTLWLPAADRRDSASPAEAAPSHPITTLPREVAGVESFAAADSTSADYVLVGNRLLWDIGAMVDAWRIAVREDERIPAARLPQAELDDHTATLLTDIALAIRMLGSADSDRGGAMRDSTAILRTVSEQHGRQRSALGWDKGAVEREMAHLQAVVDKVVLSLGSDVSPATLLGARAAVRQFIGQSMRASLSAMRIAVGEPRR